MKKLLNLLKIVLQNISYLTKEYLKEFVPKYFNFCNTEYLFDTTSGIMTKQSSHMP